MGLRNAVQKLPYTCYNILTKTFFQNCTAKCEKKDLFLY